VPDDERVAVRLGARRLLHRDVAAAARAVVDDDRLAEALLHLGGHGARDDRAGAAGRERHQEADRLGGPALRERGLAEREDEGKAGGSKHVSS
jgi:hypothetical protein